MIGYSPLSRGKGVGGSSLINYLAWDRASKIEYDGWKALGESEDGWDWDSILPYMKKSEAAAPPLESPNDFGEMSLPGKVAVLAGLSDTETIGAEGAVQVLLPLVIQFQTVLTGTQTSYNSIYSEVIAPYIKAWNNIGVNTNTNPVSIF